MPVLPAPPSMPGLHSPLLQLAATSPLGDELVTLASAPPGIPGCQGVTTAWPPACFTHVNLRCLPQQVSCVVCSRVYLLIVCSSSSQVKVQQAPM